MEKRIVILGGGESGVGAALLAQAKGYEVFVSDKSTIAQTYKDILKEASIGFEEGFHSDELILKASIVVKSPGIPNTAPIVQKLYEIGVDVIGELEFASRFTKAKLIGITGTNGKTTTTLLTYHLLKEAGLKVGLAGNVGSSLAKQVIKDEFDYYVVEISSFQLDDMVLFKPDVAILLNITPDHLDRYEYDLEKYAQSKFGIVKNLEKTAPFIYFADDIEIASRLHLVDEGRRLPISIGDKVREGAYSSEGELHFIVADGTTAFKISLSDIPLKGSHNAINTMAAVLAAVVTGVPGNAIVKGLKSFKNAPHRMEKVGEINGISFINDSKATNVDAVFYALEGFAEPLIWIAGGIDKGNNYDKIISLVKKNVKAMVCLGKDNAKLKDYFQDILPLKEENVAMKGAVEKAFSLAERGDVVLLSPACASFDLFKNYEDRGDQFRAAVGALMDREAVGSLN